MRKDSTEPLLFPKIRLRNYLIPPIASRELRNIVVSLGAAIDHIPVTRAVVIKTTNTQPGTSARLFPVKCLLKKFEICKIKLIYGTNIQKSIKISLVECNTTYIELRDKEGLYFPAENIGHIFRIMLSYLNHLFLIKHFQKVLS